MKIYIYPKSRSLRAVWAFEELGAAYEAVKVDLLSPAPCVKSPHPFGKVPFLIDGEIAISETLAICIYLCEKYPGTSLYPENPQQKASVNSWISFALTDLEAPIWNLLKHIVFTPANQRSEELMSHFRRDANKALCQMPFNPAHPWIAGNDFTLADIFVSHTLLWAKICGLEINDNLNSYMHRAMTRPAFLRAQEINNHE